VYEHLYRGGAVIEVGCWAHARRYFFKAIESDPERAKTALAWIAALFALERPAKKRRELRQTRAAPNDHPLRLTPQRIPFRLDRVKRT
jgi:transposase